VRRNLVIIPPASRIAVVMPTRGRPRQAREAVESAFQTRAYPDTVVVPVLDEGDSSIYSFASDRGAATSYVCAGNMIQRTNLAAMSLLDDYDIIGWMADDNRFRTHAWDAMVDSAFDDPKIGFVNLNDLFWSEMAPNDKPCNTFIRAEIVRALGWFANPHVEHHYMDDTWRVLGLSTDSLLYLKDVICEHMHPVLGKSDWDAQYRSTETGEQLARDQGQFVRWIWNHFKTDREKVKSCLDS
jgi:hypothetical protein